ncbi:MAG TPA: hypothetical protein IGS37_06420 [Synechococcales cyanobacterium M55_K2018_004]|nr:hypothetical protein [Synechococcales cyanobacterium M55_K2018_004]
MSSSGMITPSQALSLEAFCQLQGVLQEMATRLEGTGLLLTEADLEFYTPPSALVSGSPPPPSSPVATVEKFTVLVSKTFSALLRGHSLQQQDVDSQPEDREAEQHATPPSAGYFVALTFDPQAIASFLQHLLPQVQSNPQLVEQVTLAAPWLGPNDPLRQSEFTLQLLAAMDSEARRRSLLEESCTQSCAQIQRDNLEQEVQSRTQNLQDAVLAAQTANRAKSQFLAAISHELRTPLTAIIGMSSTLLRWSFGEMSDRQRRFLQTIHSSGQRLLELINDMLDLSQLEEGKIVLQPREFSLSLLVQQTLREFQDMATEKSIELELDMQVDPRFDQFVADAQRIRQILSNLLSNAIKFTGQGGRVTLRVFADQYYAVLRVKDTGIGIPEEQRSLLFQKFQQLDDSYRRVYQGAGLGLALTKQLVELHGGRISVESTVGVGSVFTVQIPNQQPASAEASAIPAPPADHLLGRIVLIESHEETANIICDLLTAANYQVIWMLEDMIAINQIEVLQPLVVILDLEPDNRAGHTLVAQLRQNPATKHVKVVALQTAKPLEGPLTEAGLAVDGRLLKPIQPEQVLPCIFNLTVDSVVDV